MAEIDPRDAVLQAHVPTVMVPLFSALDPLDRNGHRYLVALDGLWIEVKRPWLYLLWQIAPSLAPMPYGVLEDTMDFAFEWDAFYSLVEQFRQEACKALPNEHAAWFVWDERTRQLAYRRVIAIDAGPAGIKLHRPPLEAHEHLAVDIHSHGTLSAGFSATDDEDDAGEIKLSVVLGNLDDPSGGTEAMRFCAQSLFIPFEKDTADRICRVCGCTDATPCASGCAWVEPDLCSACAFSAEP